MKILTVLSIVALLLGLSSPLPIWPGPLLFRHLPPGIISGILMVLSCLGSLRKGSKSVGIISFIYGILGILGGLLIAIYFLVANVMTIYLQLIIAGSTTAIVIGIISCILGYKTFKTSLKVQKHALILTR